MEGVCPQNPIRCARYFRNVALFRVFLTSGGVPAKSYAATFKGLVHMKTRNPQLIGTQRKWWMPAAIRTEVSGHAFRTASGVASGKAFCGRFCRTLCGSLTLGPQV